MKILFATGIYPPESGGPATFTFGMSAALRKRGHKVQIVSYGEGLDSSTEVIRVSRWGGPLIRYYRYGFQVLRLARKAQVVFVQGAVSEGLPATIAAWLARRPVVMRIPGDYAWEMSMRNGGSVLLEEFLKHAHRGIIGLYERIERWTARKAAHVIVPSRYLKSVVERWGVASQNIDVIVNAAEPPVETLSYEQERSTFGIKDEIIFLTAVRAVPWKGVAELITWWDQLPEGCALVIAGDGPELDSWKQLAESKQLGRRLRFLGRVDRKILARWYTAANAFILHSGYEGYPFVVAEAASFGLPCFVSDQGGNPETKDQFGDLVTVLPYKDTQAWLTTLSTFHPREGDRKPRVAQTYVEMTDQIEQLLQKYAKTI